VSVRDHSVPAGGGQVFAREWQPGSPNAAPPIILLHDSLGCITLWRDFPADLSARTGRRVIAYDRLGFGQSDAHVGRLPLDFIYEECSTSLPPLLAALKVDDFVLFGHSVGGGMSVAGAADFGPRCKGLISESAQIFREERTFEGIRAAQPNLAPGSPQRERLKKYHGEKTDWVLSSWIDNWLDPAFVLDLTRHIKRIRCPVLALHGDLDEFGSTDQAKYLCDRVAGSATLHLMKGCGHVPHRDRPAEILETVARFLA
jgi:pimeloyl-ACP methyl ester carboxylesterase